MNINNLSDLPEWDDLKNYEDEGEEWKPNPTKELCIALYNKWREIVFMLNGIIKPVMEAYERNGADERAIVTSTAAQIFADAHLVSVKIRSSEAAGMYIARMENASIIRTNAQSIASSLLLLIEEEADEAHINTLREEINSFRALFKQWVASFEKDEFTDDWGLFI